MTGAGAVAVVVVGYNHRAWLAKCFESVLHAHPDRRRLDVYYVDNASSDRSAELVRTRFPEVHTVTNSHNRGYTGGCNQALQLALGTNAEYVFLLNPDTVCPPGLLDALAAFLDANPSYGIVGPLQYRYPTDAAAAYNEWTVAALRQGEEHVFFADWPDRPSPAGPLGGRAPGTLEHAYVQGSALFTRTKLLRQIGLFNERFHSYYEDVDLCRRARWAGWRVALLLDLSVFHAGGSGGNSRYRRVHLIRNRLYYVFTDPDWPLPLALRLAGRWLRHDFRGQGVAGPVGFWTGMADTVSALVWLVPLAGPILARRRLHRTLASVGAAAARPAAGGPATG